MAFNKDSTGGTLLAAFIICLVCGVIVAVAAVMLRPMQNENRALDRQKNVLIAANAYQPGMDVKQAFESVERRFVELASGTEVERPDSYDQAKAAADPEQSTALAVDPAGIRRLPDVAEVFFLRNDDGSLRSIVLPVSGYGLWSTLYGYLALEPDANTVAGLVFYDHGETPGLGGEIDNPAWRAQWVGKTLTDSDGRVQIEVVKGSVDASSSTAQYKVDGLSGATLTSQGVSQLVRFWVGEQAFGPYLSRLRSGAVSE